MFAGGPLLQKSPEVSLSGMKIAAMAILLLLPFFCGSSARAVTLAEALAAEELIAKVDALAPDERAAFIQQNRAQLNQALMTEQIVAAIRHAVQATAQASERLYHRPLLCGVIADEDAGDDDQEVGGAPPVPPPAPLADMAKAFRAEVKASLKLPDGPGTEARLDGMDVTDVIANRMIADNKCGRKITNK